MNCYLCASRDIEQIHPRCRDSGEVKVMRCSTCGLVFLNDSRRISESFYENSGMYEFQSPDRQQLFEEEKADTDRRVLLLRPLTAGKRFLDFGCGAGAVARELKSGCGEVSVVELNKVHREAISRDFGIPAFKSLLEAPGAFDLISLFHVLEHLKDPISELASIRSRLAPGGRVVIEVPHAGDALLSLYRCEAFKNFTYWTCHLFLFTEATLKTVLEKAGFQNVEFRFEQRYPLANHLYWLSQGKPGGHKIWKEMSSPALDEAYTARLAQLKATDTLIAFAGV